MRHPVLHPLAPAAICWLAALSAAAHPGHGLIEHGALHVAASPYHLATLALAGAALWLAGHRATRPGGRRWLRGLGAASACVAGGLWVLGL
ncbi:MAG TPA: hypothetical protein PKE47_11005 [Verrucomicrobiota bacterium]|nr:hypothetical protein [Verrucomicrobiota bacterium]